MLKLASTPRHDWARMHTTSLTHTWTVPYIPSMRTFWNYRWLKIRFPLLETGNTEEEFGLVENTEIQTIYEAWRWKWAKGAGYLAWSMDGSMRNWKFSTNEATQRTVFFFHLFRQKKKKKQGKILYFIKSNMPLFLRQITKKEKLLSKSGTMLGQH